MAVAEDGSAEAGEEIEYCLPSASRDRSRGASHDDGLAGVIADEDFAGAIEDGLGLGHNFWAKRENRNSKLE